MKSSVIKRSIIRGGRKTSVSLEDQFWNGLHEIAQREKMTLSALVGRIDVVRHDCNLSSAIRVFILNDFRTRITGQESGNGRPQHKSAAAAENAGARV
jgi:predicted DNA-binding ribbon-helix-helix protein